MKLEETTVAKNYVYEGRIIKVRCDDALLPDGKPCIREVVEHTGGVCVAALTDENELLFVRQFRYPYGEILLEPPAGKLEAGEDPLFAGKRELEEETGCIAAEYYDLGKFYPSPGYCGEIIHLYLARALSKTQMHPDEDEYLEVLKMPVAEAVERVMNGELRDGKTQALVLRVAEMLRTGKWGRRI